MRSAWMTSSGCALVLGCCCLLVSGCGGEPQPQKSGAAMSMPAAKTEYVCPRCGAMSDTAGDCTHCKVAMVAKPAVYACPKCDEMAAMPGKCSQCGKEYKLEPIANPDPTMCPISHEKIEKTVCAIVGGKVYGFCCNDCVADAKAHPEKLAALDNAMMGADKKMMDDKKMMNAKPDMDDKKMEGMNH